MNGEVVTGRRARRRVVSGATQFGVGAALLGIALLSAAPLRAQSSDPRLSATAPEPEKPAQPPPAPALPGAPNPAGQTAPKLVIEEATHDFGEVWFGDPLEHYFIVKNDGTAPLQINDVKASCGCTAIPDYTKIIAPGETGRIGARLDSSKLGTGVQATKTITVTSNDTTQPTTMLTIKAKVKAYVNVEPKMVSLGNLTDAQQEVSNVVMVTNNTETPLTLEADPVTGSDRFVVSSVEETEKGKTFKLTVKGVPPYTEGSMRTIFKYRTNIEKQPSIDFTAFANLPPRLQLSSPQLIWTAQQPSVQQRQVFLYNNGKTPVNVTAAEIDNPDVKVSFSEQATQQNMPQPTPQQQPQNRQTWVVTLDFPPNYMPSEAGNTVTIKTDDSQMPTFNVAVRGMPKPTTPPTPPRNPAMDLAGKPAPPTEITTLTGESLRVNAGGESEPITVLVFYTTWCPHCRKEMPTLQKVHDNYKEKGVRVIGVSLDDKDRKTQEPFTAAMLAENAKQNNVTFPLMHDPARKVATPYKVPGYPCMFVINKTGVVESVYSGEVAETVLTGEIERIIAGKPKPEAAAADPARALAPTESVRPAPPSTSATQTPGR